MSDEISSEAARERMAQSAALVWRMLETTPEMTGSMAGRSLGATTSCGQASFSFCVLLQKVEMQIWSRNWSATAINDGQSALLGLPDRLRKIAGLLPHQLIETYRSEAESAVLKLTFPDAPIPGFLARSAALEKTQEGARPLHIRLRRMSNHDIFQAQSQIVLLQESVDRLAKNAGIAAPRIIDPIEQARGLIEHIRNAPCPT